jgi:polyferredoxin
MNKKLAGVLLIAFAAILFDGCFPGGGTNTPADPAGFFKGIWHGWIAPLSLIVSLFDGDVRLYEPNNSGWWYDAGFYIAVISGFGGISLIRRKKKDHK